MNREEAIANLNMISVAFVDPVTKEQRKLIDDTFDMAIKALEQEPKTDSWSIKDVADTFKKHGLIREQEPCEEAISRQAVLDAIDVKAWEFCDYLISENRNDEQKPVSHFADNLRECVREELPPVNPQPCEDAIDRAEAIKVASGYCHPANVAKELAKLPPVTPQPKIGYWIPRQEIIGVDKEDNEISATVGYKCSKCLIVHSHTSLFCQSCGAKMIEPQERSDKE